MIRILLLSVLALAAQARSVYLVRLGTDLRAGVDWSGELSSSPVRLAPWQFDTQDSISGNTWKCSTREQTYWDTPYERKMGPTSNIDKVTVKGLIVESDAPRDLRILTRQGEFPLAPGTYLNGRATVSVAPPTTRLTSGAEAEDYPSLLEARGGTLWAAWQTYTHGSGDQIFVARRSGETWSKPQPITEAGGDTFRTAMAEDRNGRLWAVWAAQVKGNFDLYARAFDGKTWSLAERLTSAENADIFHSLIRDSSGNLYLAYQSARNGNFDIYLRVYDGMRWSPEMQVSSDPANDWEPKLAAAPDGRVTILWDTYSAGNYDIVSRTYAKGKLGPLTPITRSGAFESRVSAQYDRQGRLWMAWDQGDWNWGKDYGQVIPEMGRGLLVKRQTRVAVLDNGKLLEPFASIGDAVTEEFRQMFQQPVLLLDRNGNPWVFFRYRTNLPQLRGRNRETQRALWRMAATTLQSNGWTPMMEFPEGFGRIDSPASAVLGRNGEIQIAWTSDGRVWPNGVPREQDIFLASLPSSSAPAMARLTPFAPDPERVPPSHVMEARDVQQVRSYRTRVAGKELRIARGDVHRHTDISWDGNRDGSLHDAYRYALDAAAFDYLGVCDHQAGQEVPYNWWMIEKAVDLFTIRGRFTPLYSYERSLPYPNGHRNVLFAERGRPVLPISEAEQQGTEGAAKLYAYLRKLGGITAAHTSATGAGTDWRDNDAEVEPVVEIYQGYRYSYETAGAPRSSSGESAKFAAGYVSNAWGKGIRLGVQSSSDHVSTHVSYAALYVDRLDRAALISAFKARRTFAATDNIVVDLRMGDHFMGDLFDSSATAPLKAYVKGTGSIERVDVIKSNRVVYSAPGGLLETTFTWSDADVKPGEVFYYIRVEQKDGQIAWSSPIWVRYH
jgi:hypothetical protein